MCREVALPVPPWTEAISSPAPYFPFPAKSFAMRLLLMLESPLPLKRRRVFVPACNEPTGSRLGDSLANCKTSADRWPLTTAIGPFAKT